MVDERFISDGSKKKVEASVPVQSRVDIRALAEMVLYWEDSGYHIRSMSQLVNWSMDLLVQVLRVNGKMKWKVETVLEAHDEMEKRGLYQRSMKKRSMNKIVRARQLENLRIEGTDPKTGWEGRREYDLAHNSHTLDPAPDILYDHEGEERRKRISQATEEAFKRIRDEEIKEAKEAISSRLTFNENGRVVIPKTEGMYTAEDRKREIAQARERLGLTKSEATEESVGSSKSKSNQTHPNECIEENDEEGQTPASAEEALSLFNKVRDKKVVSAKQDLTPRKLTDKELECKEELIHQKDQELKSQLDSVSPNDLSPIDD